MRSYKLAEGVGRMLATPCIIAFEDLTMGGTEARTTHVEGMLSPIVPLAVVSSVKLDESDMSITMKSSAPCSGSGFGVSNVEARHMNY
jgi:hypothetical protein